MNGAPGFSLDVADEADIEGMIAVFESVAGESQWLASELPLDNEKRRTRLTAAIANEDTLNLIARCEARLVGLLTLTTGWPGVFDLGMAIEAPYRSRGIGSALLAHAIDWARERGAHKIALHVYPHNTAAIALYVKHGFIREGLFRKHQRRKNGELWDTLPMGLLLV